MFTTALSTRISIRWGASFDRGDADPFKAVVSGAIEAKFGKLPAARGAKILVEFEHSYRPVFSKVRPVSADDMAGPTSA